MIKSNYSKEERLALVMECRKSGLTDSLWCQQHGIHVGTFYNWVKRFRNQGISVPVAVGKNVAPVKQEVVKVDIIDSEPYELQSQTFSSPINTGAGVFLDDNNLQASNEPVIEVALFGAQVKFPDTINPAILSKTLHLIKELSC